MNNKPPVPAQGNTPPTPGQPAPGQPAPAEAQGQTKTEEDPALTVARAEVITEGFKGLLIVNGGGAAALLAFVQRTWTLHQISRASLFMASGGWQPAWRSHYWSRSFGTS